jgi:hypothetical protein
MPSLKPEVNRLSIPCRLQEPAPANGLLARALDPLLARFAVRHSLLLEQADPDEHIEEGLACLSAAEELQLSRLLRKLERHLQTLLADHDSPSPCELS